MAHGPHNQISNFSFYFLNNILSYLELLPCEGPRVLPVLIPESVALPKVEELLAQDAGEGGTWSMLFIIIPNYLKPPDPRTHPQCPPPQASLPSRPGRGLCRPRARRHSPTSPPSSGPSRPPMGNELTVTRPLIGLSLSDLVTFADKH